MKTCTKCQEVKNLDQFYKRSDRDTYISWCKLCKNKSSASWHERNKQKHSEINAKWYQENKERHLANNKQWYENNKDVKLASTTAREKRCILATPTWADKELIKELYILAKKLTEQTGIQHEVDHIVPLKGDKVSGLHVEHNLQVITAEENRRKSNKFQID